MKGFQLPQRVNAGATRIGQKVRFFHKKALWTVIKKESNWVVLEYRNIVKRVNYSFPLYQELFDNLQ
ncbi:hypothetical protein BXY85_3742 [Roseivirga pacifica]|uniref:Uncharacterized protein n=1 Tax=Roseivirga pacifica TaxID=1267423 RepID=A0A1I0Q9Y4_9BACT|nr:hypothetical protein BXY85_3742 [Roseivirga pacifica]SEW23608.1 hypothetical protein SAMN05216290_2133 [Roseivirga pacifica]